MITSLKRRAATIVTVRGWLASVATIIGTKGSASTSAVAARRIPVNPRRVKAGMMLIKPAIRASAKPVAMTKSWSRSNC